MANIIKRFNDVTPTTNDEAKQLVATFERTLPLKKMEWMWPEKGGKVVSSIFETQMKPLFKNQKYTSFGFNKIDNECKLDGRR